MRLPRPCLDRRTQIAAFAPVPATPDGGLRCAYHPDTPTGLRCGKCGTPICPKCAVATSVGQRCPDCAHARPLPTYEVGATVVARALAAGIGVALVLGTAWGYLDRAGLRRGATYDWSFWFALLTGFVVAEVVSWSANRKRGALLAWVAVGSVLLTVVVSRLVIGARALAPVTGGAAAARATDLGAVLHLDFTHLLFVAMACGIAYIRFR